MKKSLVLAILILAQRESYSQTFAEWFQQRRTQIRYLTNQIAALRVYAGYVHDGYKIVDKGLQAIGQIKSGDFSLHSDFFSGLRTVSPIVRKDPEVRRLISFQAESAKSYRIAMKAMSNSQQFSEAELSQARRVYSGLLADQAYNLEELESLLTSDVISLTEQERLTRIRTLSEDSRQLFKMVKEFGNENLLLAANRFKESRDAQTMRKLYGL